MKIDNFKLAHDLNRNFKLTLLKENLHFRASLNSISLISLSMEKPELGVSCKKIKNGKENDLEQLVQNYFSEIKKKPIPGRSTPEKSLQAWIINYAINNEGSLPFDSNIKFITSELAIFDKEDKKVVTDILGFDIQTGKICVIELKTSRSLKRLKEQVDNFGNIIIYYHNFFADLLKIYGYGENLLTFEIRKILVWPYKHTSPLKELKHSFIEEITYDDDINFVKHSL